MRDAAQSQQWQVSTLSNFNPRTPCGVRPRPAARSRGTDYISIHAPRAGCDREQLRAKKHLANFNPRTPCGVRLTRGNEPERISHFNPRTPCGVRHDQPQTVCPCQSKFQSTHPMRGATELITADDQTETISIHAPHAGCDAGAAMAGETMAYFNPRTPCGVRLGADNR